MEFKRTLKGHEEIIQDNRNFLFSLTTKLHENEHRYASQHATIMNLLFQQRQKLDVLEVECNILRILAINLNKEAQSTTSNNMMSINSTQVEFRGEETIHQMKDAMDIEQQNSLSLNVDREEANNQHIFR